MTDTTPPKMHLVAEIEKRQGIGDYTVLSWKRGLIPFLKEFPLGTTLWAVAPEDRSHSPSIERIDPVSAQRQYMAEVASSGMGMLKVTMLGREEIEKRFLHPITHTAVNPLPSGVTLDAATGKIHGNRNPREKVRIKASNGIKTIEYVYPYAPLPKDFEL